jgi:hypothetical protein
MVMAFQKVLAVKEMHEFYLISDPEFTLLDS